MAARATHTAFVVAGRFLAHPLALAALAAFVAAWLLFGDDSLDWHGWATVVTLAIALVIEANQRRDTRALQAKLDELIRATEGARNEVAAIEAKPPAEADRVLREA